VAADVSAAPWEDDVRRALALLKGAASQIISDPQVQELVHRTGPDLLDKVSDLASGLAAGLRSETPDSSADSSGLDGEPPSTVRIDVTD
jgi:hypothetical protein